MKKWDLTLGICPWGHQLSECHEIYYNKKRKLATNYCRITKTKMNRDLRERKRNHTRTIVVNDIEVGMRMMGRPTKGNRKQLMTRTGTLSYVSLSHSLVQLVCGHILKFEKGVLWRSDRASYPLYCLDCEVLKDVHQISPGTPNQRGLVYYPLEEEKPKVKPVKHEKNAGSARA